MQNKAEISFEVEGENNLNVTIETKRIHMESVKESDTENYVRLFAKPENRAKFADGKPLAPEKTKAAVTKWVSRWHDNNPFSAFAVSQREEEVFMGHVVLGYGDKRGETELAYVFDQMYWGKGYGKESVHPVVKEYPLEVKKKGYRLKYQEGEKVEWAEHTGINATSRIDNPASTKILESAGLKKVSQSEKWGHERYHFCASVEEIGTQVIGTQTDVKANAGFEVRNS